MENLDSGVDVIEIFNSLSNNDLCKLINMMGDRADIYIGCLGRTCISTEITWACMNGAGIQINTKLSELEDIREDDSVNIAIERMHMTKEEVEAEWKEIREKNEAKLKEREKC